MKEVKLISCHYPAISVPYEVINRHWKFCTTAHSDKLGC